MVKVAVRRSEQNRRDDIEDFLIAHHVTHTYKEDVSTSQFDQEKSLRNQARLGHPLNEDVAKRYAEAALDGDVFPPVLAERDPSTGKLVILDGNHRLRGHIIAGVPLDVYICEAAPQVLVMLTFLANAKHGLPSSEEDRVHHAMFLVDNGISQAEAARQLGVPRPALAKAVAKKQAARRADEAGILRPVWDAIPTSSRNRLGNIHTDEGFAAAVQLVADAGMLNEDVFKLVAQMNETRNAKRQVAVVKNWREQFEDQIQRVKSSGRDNVKGKHVSNPRARLASAMGMVAALPAPAVYLGEELPEQIRAEYANRIDEAIKYLMEIREVLA